MINIPKMNYVLSLASLLIQSPNLSATTTKVKPSSKTINSSDSLAQNNVARIIDLVVLVKKPHIRVQLVTVDTGGTTDVSPTQRIFFTAYARSDSFSTDLSFRLGSIFEMVSSKRLSAGVYEVVVKIPGKRGPESARWRIDARKALTDIKKVYCEYPECPASKDFKATIDVTVL